jgi:predicted NUDIX family NTP pyrophosphohydrolase
VVLRRTAAAAVAPVAGCHFDGLSLFVHAGYVVPRQSAGVLLHRHEGDALEVLLAHMGGPFWMKKDQGAWSIPKGEYEPGDDPLIAAQREFEEELGSAPPFATYRPLGSIRQQGGKLVTVWALEGDFDASAAVSNTFEIEWPPGSGLLRSFPEVDRADWFTLDVARTKLVKGQIPFLDRLVADSSEG